MLTLAISPGPGSPRSFEPFVEVFDDFAPWRDAYPAHNLERLGRDRYRLTLAVPGFAEDELSVEASLAELTVRGRRHATGGRFAADEFEFRGSLPDHMRVTGAHLAHGLLAIDLTRELPEALKPRVIPIRGDAKPPLLRGESSGESMIGKLRRVLTGRKAA